MSWTDKSNPEFEQWWAMQKAAGYDYGREALENVRFGFEGAQSQRWQPIQTAPKDGSEVVVARIDDAGIRWWYQAYWNRKHNRWQTRGGTVEPNYWLSLPDPPSFDQAGK